MEDRPVADRDQAGGEEREERDPGKVIDRDRGDAGGHDDAGDRDQDVVAGEGERQPDGRGPGALGLIRAAGASDPGADRLERGQHPEQPVGDRDTGQPQRDRQQRQKVPHAAVVVRGQQRGRRTGDDEPRLQLERDERLRILRPELPVQPAEGCEEHTWIVAQYGLSWGESHVSL